MRSSRNRPGHLARRTLAALTALALIAGFSPLAHAGKPKRGSNNPASEGPLPRLEVIETSIPATGDFKWFFLLLVRNHTEYGIYPDSMNCEVTDLDPGLTRGPRTRIIPMNFVKRLLPSVGSHDSAAFNYQSMALSEHARLILRLYVHAADARQLTLSDTLEATPGSSSQDFPSVTFQDGGRTIEYVYARPHGDRPSAPAILLLHGDESRARHLVPLANELIEKGYHVMMVSQPGYGTSSGEPDLMGPATTSAIAHALDALKRTPGVDSTRIGVWGVGRGANIAARLDMTRGDIAAAVAIGGLYDLQAVARASATQRAKFVQEAGKDSAAWALRSPATLPLTLNGPLLVIHSDTDAEAPAAQATAFVAALRAAGQSAELKLLPSADRYIPMDDSRTAAFEFFERLLKPSQ